MKTFSAPLPQAGALSTRLSRLADLAQAEYQVLRDAEHNVRPLPARRELIIQGEPVRERRAFLSGWACRQRILMDGQRQILSFLLPGDLIGICNHHDPAAAATILAVTEVTTCSAPEAAPGSELAEAFARSAALEEHYFLAQITRLGRMNAIERTADWLLETRDRLALVDMVQGDQFSLPITQEMLADTLGLTSVHVNRTLQAMRKDGLLQLRSGMISLDRERMERLVDYKPAQVSASS